MLRIDSQVPSPHALVRMCAAAVVAAGLASCAPADLAGPEADHAAGGPSLLPNGLAAPDVSGNWSWSRTEAIRMPSWFVVSVLNSIPSNNVQPEGPNTHATCVSEGAMNLTQTGSTFSGTAAILTNSCETRGGQPFTQPGIGLPHTVSDGRITGQSLQFSLANLTVAPCPLQAVITDAVGGIATAFSGTGRCVLPGHPHSESIVPLGPPPGGTSKIRSFDAWR